MRNFGSVCTFLTFWFLFEMVVFVQDEVCIEIKDRSEWNVRQGAESLAACMGAQLNVETALDLFHSKAYGFSEL